MLIHDYVLLFILAEFVTIFSYFVLYFLFVLHVRHKPSSERHHYAVR